MMIMTKIIVATFYHFTSLEDPTSLRGPLLATLSSHGVRGTVLLAPEGINGTLSGSRMDIDAALNTLRAFPAFTPLEHKESYAEVMPFYRLKVRVKKEIVTMGVPDIDPLASVGTYVEPEDWNALIADPGTIVIDARNDFEVGVGTFEGAVNPGTSSFSDLPRWLNQHRTELEGKKVAMFCTGGIRCEKATSYLNKQGIKDILGRIRNVDSNSHVTADDLVNRCLDVLGPISVSIGTEAGLKTYASKFGDLSWDTESKLSEFEDAALAVIRLIVCTQEYQTV